MDLKLKDLRYLVAVADLRHFGRAAARCFVSQPTLSAQLKKLEQSFGLQLIERAPNNVSLTAAGEEIVARARRIIEASDEVVALARSQRDPLAGPLRLALLPTIGPYLLPRVAPAIRRALPRLELRLYEYQTAPMLERLRGGELDVGILALPVELDGLESHELYREAFVVALPERHPLAAHGTLRVADLKGETLLLLEDGHCLRDQALEVCSRAGVREPQDFRATSLETLRQMVATGAGVTLLPELAVHGAYRSARGVALRPFARPAPVRHVGAVWRKTSARPAALATLATRFAPLPLATLGHSVGGQLLGCMPNHALARAHVMVATSTGYWRRQRAPFRYLALGFWKLHGPLMLRLVGYVPQGLLWPGESLPRGVFLQWRKWCLQAVPFGPGLDEELRDSRYPEVRAPLLCLSFSDDPIATPAAVEALLASYPNAQIERRWIRPREAGVRHIGHHGFFSERHRDSLWRAALDWIDARCA